MGGVKKLSTTPAMFRRPVAALGSTESFTFLTLFRTWAVKQWQIENPDKPALNAEQIFMAEHGGDVGPENRRV